MTAIQGIEAFTNPTIDPKTIRVLNNALATGRTTFGDLEILLQEDAQLLEQLSAIRTELETISEQPSTPESDERVLDLTQNWLNLDPASVIQFLDTIRQDAQHA